MTLALAIIGTALGLLNFLWLVWTWRNSGSRVHVETSFRIFPGLARSQMLDLLAQIQQPAGLAKLADEMIKYQAQFVMPLDLGYPASAELMAVVPPESIMLVATITNTGRLPVTILRCRWGTSQHGVIEAPNLPPGVSFPHRLAENDQCISVITLATIMAILDAPLRDKNVTGRQAWPIVEVANVRKPIRGNSLSIPSRVRPSSEPVAGP